MLQDVAHSEIFLRDRLESVAGTFSILGLLAGRILAELHLRMELCNLFPNAELDDLVALFDGLEALRRGRAE